MLAGFWWLGDAGWMNNKGIGHKFGQQKVKSRINAQAYIDVREANAFNAGMSYAYEMLDARYPEIDLRVKVEAMLAEMREQQLAERVEAQEGASGIVLPTE